MSRYARSFVFVFLVFLVAVTALSVANGSAQESAQATRPGRTDLEPPFPYPYEDEGTDRLSPGSATLLPWSKVAFHAFNDGNWNIYVRNDDGSGLTRLTSSTAAELHPHLNRGATHVVYAQQAGDFEIYKMNVDGSNPLPLTSNGADDGRPVWSPDGTKIAFESYRDGQAEIYVMNADGGNQTRLTAHGDYDGMPAWSPDGAQIAFVSRRTGGYRIWVMNADGSGQMQVSGQPNSFHPKWSPDGTQIAFDADGDGDGWQELWRMNADGSDAEEAHDPGETAGIDAWAGSWSPDGRYIAFTRIRFVNYAGNWYWTEATLQAWESAGDYTFPLSYQGREWEPHWQTTDTQPPTSRVWPLTALTSARYAAVSWHGQDAGPSGMGEYDVQSRIGADGAWQPWLSGTATTSFPFPATPGTTVYFRSRAHDNAYNWESWPTAADAHTTFYDRSVAGSVTDNRGVPLAEKGVTIQPEALRSLKTDEQGTFQGYTVAAGEHILSISSVQYGALEETPFEPARGGRQRFYLPPRDDVLQNGSFEADNGQPLGWSVDGSLPTGLTYESRASGENALSMGSACTAVDRCATVAQADPNIGGGTYNPPVLAGDIYGNLHALWVRTDSTRTSVYYGGRSFDGTWLAPILVDQSPLVEYSIKLHAAFDSQGTLHAVWVDREGLKHVVKPEGRSWTTPDVIDDVEYGPNSGVADLAIAPDGGLHFLLDGSLYYYERRPDGRWQRPQLLWGERVNSPRLVVGPDSAVHTFWQATYSGDPAGDYFLFYRVRSPEGVWQPKEFLFIDLDHSATNVVDTAFDRLGVLHLFWADFYDVRHTMKMPDGTWTTHHELGYMTPSWRWDLDSEGTVHLLDDQGELPEHRLYYRHYTHETGWTEPVDLEPGGAHRELLSFEIDPNDSLHLVTFVFPETLFYQGVVNAGADGHTIIAQQTSIPLDMPAPTLSFMARARQDLANDGTGVQVFVTDGLTSTAVFSQTLLNEWRQYWVDLEAWRGETITVSFRLDQRFDDPWMELFLDDVTVGSAHPDTWVGVSGPGAAKPGDEVAYQIDYGNRGAVDVYTGTLTVALPPELVFQAASRPPTSLSPLTWDVGALPAQSVGERLVLTATVANTTTPLLTISSHFTVEGIPSEIESANNAQALPLLIGERRLLPAVSTP